VRNKLDKSIFHKPHDVPTDRAFSAVEMCRNGSGNVAVAVDIVANGREKMLKDFWL
jgi:hypothetical protein